MDIMTIIHNPAFIWIAIAVIFAVVEAFTLGITCIWFAAGAGVAAVIALIGFGVPVQIVAFVLVSIVLLIATRPLAKKYLNSKVEATNIHALIGQKATVIEPIPAGGKGRVKADGKLWSAQTETEDNTDINEGESVEITEVRGVTLIVKR